MVGWTWPSQITLLTANVQDAMLDRSRGVGDAGLQQLESHPTHLREGLTDGGQRLVFSVTGSFCTFQALQSSAVLSGMTL